LLEEYSKILVVEEHFSTGGLTSEFLSTAVSHGLKSEIYSITIPEEYGLTGDYKFALESRGISQPIIEEKIQEILANKAK
jgi:transketolase C-terminal domain/subunit